jgi:hypothetical protein
MAYGTRMNQMGESVATLKKQMEKFDKELERIDVDRKFEEVMNKLFQMTKLLMILKNPEVS